MQICSLCLSCLQHLVWFCAALVPVSRQASFFIVLFILFYLFLFVEVPSANPEVHGLPLVGLDTKISRPTGDGGGRLGVDGVELEHWRQSWSVGVGAGALESKLGRWRSVGQGVG